MIENNIPPSGYGFQWQMIEALNGEIKINAGCVAVMVLYPVTGSAIILSVLKVQFVSVQYRRKGKQTHEAH
jgi:hypothetical protein